MGPPSGAASYKKKDGTLTMAQDEQSVSWIPAAGGVSGTITIPVANITSQLDLMLGTPTTLLMLTLLYQIYSRLRPATPK